MAGNSPPRHVMRQLFTPAKAPHVSMRSTPGIGSSMGGRASSGLAQAFDGGAGRQSRAAADVTDPAVSGDFERMPHTYLYGFPIAGGGLSERGKEQQTLNQRIQQYNQQITGMTQQGATFQEAFRALARSNPEALTDLMAHPQALRSMENLTQVLQGGQTGPTYGPVDKQGRQVAYDPQTGEALSAKKVPGLEPPPEKPTLLKTDQGYATLGPDGRATPVLGPNGEQAKLAPTGTGKQQAPMAQSDIAGLPPQVTSDTPKTAFNRQNYNTLAATPEVMAALQRMQTAAVAMGPVKGPISVLSGEYFGLNGTGAQFKADQDLIQTQAMKMTGSAYAANTKNFMAGIGTASNAPSFIKLQAGQMLTTLRNEGQEIADKETADHQGKLPPSLVNNLIKSGIVPNGYQTQQTLDQMPPGEAALWKSRYAPQALSDTDKAQLATDAANGKFGPPNAQNTNADFRNIIGIRQQDRQKELSKQQQQTASTAALAAQAPNTPYDQAVRASGQTPTSPQPVEGTEAGAQQPQQPTQQSQQPAQQGPTPAPQDLQQNGQQGQAENPQNNAQGTPTAAGLAPGAAASAPISPLMPPQTVPGQPAQGMPATNATTPQPPLSPLPQRTSQMLTPQGSVPTPATQAPVDTTLPDVNVTEPASAYAPIPPAPQE